MEKLSDIESRTESEAKDTNTMLALERTRLAKERTFAAWIRTGLAPMAIGLGLVKLLPAIQPGWLIQALGVVLVISGLAIFIFGYTTYVQVLAKLQQEGYEGVSSHAMKFLTIMLLIAAFMSLALIFIE